MRLQHLTLAVAFFMLFQGQALASDREAYPEDKLPLIENVITLDGRYVHTVGNLQMNITNHGLIGSQYTLARPYSWAPSGQWPGGTGDEYLWGAGLWIGGKINGEPVVSTGQPERELRPGPGIFDTMYEWSGSAKPGDGISLEALCQALGIPSPKEHGDGSQVAQLVETNDLDRLQTYNIADVKAVREIWRRIK